MTKMEMVVVVLGLLAMVQQSMQLSLKNPLPLLHRNIRAGDVPAFGLITTSQKAEMDLRESPLFVHTSDVDLFGRRFVMGEIYGAPVVLVRTSSKPSVHAGITVQIMADNFDLAGIIHFGSAGSTNNSLKIGTVSVPRLVGFTGVWEWLNEESANEQEGKLVIKDFNRPQNGQNVLGVIDFDEVDIYYKEKILKSFWVYPNSMWLHYAMSIKIESGDVVVGLNSSTDDIYVNNRAYRNFLRKTFRVSTVDTSSAAVGLGAKSNDLKFISLQAVSNYAGGPDAPADAKQIARKNVVEAVIKFIRRATVPRYARDI